MELIDKYGSCTLIKNTLLFHSGDIKSDSPVFFSFHPFIAKIFSGSSENITVYLIKKNLPLLFMIKELDGRSWTKTAITEIYQSFYPHDKECDDLDIKFRDRSKRTKFIKKLEEQGLLGWFSSLEDNYELEVCIFRQKTIQEYLEAKSVVNIDDYESIDFTNALKKAILKPSVDFIKTSRQNVSGYPFNRYKNHILNCIKDECDRGGAWKFCCNSNYTLRLKLKI